MSDLVAEALRLYGRYEREFIVAFGLCPYADRARREGRVRERVLLDTTVSLASALEANDALVALPEVEIGLLLYPRLRASYREFEHFVSSVRQADEERSNGAAAMAMAAFHPDGARDVSSPARLVPFIRRSPDPTIQLVRQSALDRVRRGASTGTEFMSPSVVRSLLSGDALQALESPSAPLHERIAQANWERLREVGFDAAEAILVDIAADRTRTYARFEDRERGS